jgi:glycerol-3-phosphate O-acyltransferase
MQNNDPVIFCTVYTVYGQVAGACECGNELSGSIKRGEFLD